jgi:ribonucleoside-diphosphate reductase alpha chain
MSQILITKRNGTKEPLNIEKLHKVVLRACEGISGVSPSEVELKSQIQFFNGMKSTDIQETLIKAAANLITEETPNYQYVAGKLVNYHLRKIVYNSYTPLPLYEHVESVVKVGYYTEELLKWYTKEEFEKMDSFIDHSRDEDFSYVAMEQFRGKYLIKNRVTGKIYETPQMAYMLIAATLFHSYPQETRMKYVRDYYDCISQHYISLPTPVIAGVRTPQKQFSSCVLIESGDSLDSINATASSIVKYVSQRAGIGVNIGRIRAKGSPIRKGDAFHTGIIPFIKYFQAATKSCSQGSIRNGAATAYFPIWHLEVEDLIVLKNNKGTEETRVRHLDYAVQLSKLFYERFLKNQDITLFCPNDVPGLYEAFFSDQEKFKELYEAAEKRTSIRKKKVSARELFSAIMEERKSTGRLYIMNVDNCNEHSSFDEKVAPITMSNLCLEIGLPVKPMGTPEERIQLCTLSAINWGKIDHPDDFKKPCELAVRALDALLSYQDFPVECARKSTEEWRPLGVGINNLAYWLAKNGLTYEGNAETFDTLSEFMEAFSYYLIKASNDLAKEYGPCTRSNDTKYGKGILPIDTYKKDVDTISNPARVYDWEDLRQSLKEYGIRNATLMAIMPSETSSTVINATNGIEPPRAFVSYKNSKDGILAQVVPGYPRLKNKYQLLWNIKSPEGYLKICAIIQKYVDQLISVNTSYNPKYFPNEELSMEILLRHLLLHYKWGGKTLYYFNTNDQAGEEEINPTTKKIPTKIETDDCESGACKL